MKTNKPEKNEPMLGNERLPRIEIVVPQACIDFREQPKELILVTESQYYVSAIFNILMMVSNSEIHRDTEVTFAIRTLAHLGNSFNSIG